MKNLTEKKKWFFFGRQYGKNIRIIQAVYYKRVNRSRTSITINYDNMVRRAKELRAKRNMKWLGTYHTHVEEGEDISYGLSDDDRDSLMAEPTCLGLTVCIWATNDPSMSKPCIRRLTEMKRFDNSNYRYIISGYYRTSKSLHLVPLEYI